MFTIVASGAACRWGHAYFVAQKTLPVKVPVRIEFQSSVVYSASGLNEVATSAVGAALLIRVDSEPKRSTVASTTLRTLASSVTSSAKNSASPPASRIRWTTFCPRSTVLPVTATRAPSDANSSAIVRPMPRVDPEINATLPAKRSPIYGTLRLDGTVGRIDRSSSRRWVNADAGARVRRVRPVERSGASGLYVQSSPVLADGLFCGPNSHDNPILRQSL